MGIGADLPYFWAINDDKDLTVSSKLFASEHPLFLGEYRQAFKNSNLIFDFQVIRKDTKILLKKKNLEINLIFSRSL